MTLPNRLKHLSQFRGYPIPFTAYVRPDGTPDFKITDAEKWYECARGKLCAICGKDLEYWVWYLAGDPATIQKGQKLAYADLGMHEECARYSATVCPYVSGDITYAKYIKPVDEEGVILVDMAPRKEVKRMYLTRGRKSAMRFMMNDRCVLPGTLMEVELVSIRKEHG
jgi:hypothetical protein